MRLLHRKIEEEKERLRFLKESGEGEEFTMPKKPAGRQPAREPHSLPDLDTAGEGYTDTGFEMETESLEMETTATGEGEEKEEEEEIIEEEEEEDPFSDRNRWRRGVLEDPDADQW